VERADDGGDRQLYTDFTIRAILGLTNEINNENFDHEQPTSSMIQDTYETRRFPSFSGTIHTPIVYSTFQYTLRRNYTLITATTLVGIIALSCDHNCDSTTTRLRYDHDARVRLFPFHASKKLTCQFFVVVLS